MVIYTAPDSWNAMKCIAAIDIGSQTIRLLIADCGADVLYPLERAREIVQLGSGMQANTLLPQRIEHAAACIQRFCSRARAHNANEILAVATACVRQAQNRLDFTTRVQQTSGISLTALMKLESLPLLHP